MEHLGHILDPQLIACVCCSARHVAGIQCIILQVHLTMAVCLQPVSEAEASFKGNEGRVPHGQCGAIWRGFVAHMV